MLILGLMVTALILVLISTIAERRHSARELSDMESVYAGHLKSLQNKIVKLEEKIENLQTSDVVIKALVSTNDRLLTVKVNSLTAKLDDAMIRIGDMVSKKRRQSP